MPEDSVTLWSWCMVTFVEPLFKIANERTLNEEDIWDLSPFFLHKSLFTKYLAYTKR